MPPSSLLLPRCRCRCLTSCSDYKTGVGKNDACGGDANVTTDANGLETACSGRVVRRPILPYLAPEAPVPQRPRGLRVPSLLVPAGVAAAAALRRLPHRPAASHAPPTRVPAHAAHLGSAFLRRRHFAAGRCRPSALAGLRHPHAPLPCHADGPDPRRPGFHAHRHRHRRRRCTPWRRPVRHYAVVSRSSAPVAHQTPLTAEREIENDYRGLVRRHNHHCPAWRPWTAFSHVQSALVVEAEYRARPQALGWPSAQALASLPQYTPLLPYRRHQILQLIHQQAVLAARLWLVPQPPTPSRLLGFQQ